jgi:AbiV family abortive infection protein
MENQFSPEKLQKSIDYWLESAEHDLDSAELLFKNKRYTWCLFLSHLVLEKTLKALWVKTNKDIVVPRIHNLKKLAQMCRIKLDEEETRELIRITEFNIETRYPEEQEKLYKKCTRVYASKHFSIIKTWRKRILLQLKK